MEEIANEHPRANVGMMGSGSGQMMVVAFVMMLLFFAAFLALPWFGAKATFGFGSHTGANKGPKKHNPEEEPDFR